MTRRVRGVGINDADYQVTEYAGKGPDRKQIWECPIYQIWFNMLQRGYSASFKKRQPTYEGVTVCDEWLNSFMAFRGWVLTQDWEGKRLDKDLLVVGNKVYSPETCKFIDTSINNLLTYKKCNRSGLMMGVSRVKSSKNPYVARIKVSGETIHTGCYPTELEAHRAYLLAKRLVITNVAKEQSDSDIREGLMRHAQHLEDLYKATFKVEAGL